MTPPNVFLSHTNDYNFKVEFVISRFTSENSKRLINSIMRKNNSLIMQLHNQIEIILNKKKFHDTLNKYS